MTMMAPQAIIENMVDIKLGLVNANQLNTSRPLGISICTN